MNQQLFRDRVVHRLINTDVNLDIRKQVHIFWEGTQFAVHSLSLINREICSSIIDSGVAELTIVPYEPDQFSIAGNQKFERLHAYDIRNKGLSIRDRTKRPHIWVRHQWPPRRTPPGKAKWIIMHPWEYSAIPKFYAETFNLADEIWTPTHFSRNAFISSGIDPSKVHIVPNGTDPDLFSPIGEALRLQTNKRFRFLFVGGTLYRKGIDILLDSYGRAFTSKDDVCLVIKDLGVNSLYKGQTAQDLIRRFQNQEGMPEILYLENELNEEQMAKLYRACDVFVSSYRGEGFSLPTLEAMSSGLPVIVTSGGATDDFIHEDVGWLIAAEKRSVGRKVYGHMLDRDAFLLEPSVHNLQEIMREVYRSPSEILRKGVKGALRAQKDWTWKNSLLHIISRIDSLCGTTMEVELRKCLKDIFIDSSLIEKAIELKLTGHG